MKTQTFRTLRTGCLITIFLPLGGGGGAKTLFVMTVLRQLPEVKLILYDQIYMKTT